MISGILFPELPNELASGEALIGKQLPFSMLFLTKMIFIQGKAEMSLLGMDLYESVFSRPFQEIFNISVGKCTCKYH